MTISQRSPPRRRPISAWYRGRRSNPVPAAAATDQLGGGSTGTATAPSWRSLLLEALRRGGGRGVGPGLILVGGLRLVGELERAVRPVDQHRPAAPGGAAGDIGDRCGPGLLELGFLLVLDEHRHGDSVDGRPRVSDQPAQAEGHQDQQSATRPVAHGFEWSTGLGGGEPNQ